MDQILKLINYVDFKLIVLIVVLALFAKKNLVDVAPRIKMAHKVLVLASVISALYFFTWRVTGLAQIEDWPVYVISYCVATSLYEILIAPVVGVIAKAFGAKVPTQLTELDEK